MLRRSLSGWGATLRDVTTLILGVAACLALCWQGKSAHAQTPGFSGRLLDIDLRLGEGVFWTEAMLRGNGITSANIQSDITAVVEAADFGGNVGGQFDRNLPYPGGSFTPGGNGEDFGVLLEATVTIPAGKYQMAFGSDDAGWINLRGIPFFNRVNDEEPINAAFFGMFNDAVWYDDTRGIGWTGGTFEVAQQTTTRFRGFFMENGGGDVFEVAIRDASAFETLDIGQSNLLNRDFDNWVLLEDGALGWSVTTDLDPNAPPVDHVGGKTKIGAATRAGVLQNAVFGPEELFEGKVFLQRYNIPGRGGNFDSIANARNFIANNNPAAQGLIEQIIWSNDDFYPEALGYGVTRTNRDNYGVLVTGEIFVPTSNVQFKDGNDDFTGFVIDLDGDGMLEDTEVIIEDDSWTNMEGQDNGGSPVSFATFSNLPAAGAWRKFEFYMGEGGGGDSAHLAWDQNQTLLEFPFLDGDPLTQEHTIRSQSFRVTAPGPVIGGELSADLVAGPVSSLVFQVDVEGLEWDTVGISGNPNREAVTATLNVDGANIIVDIVNGEPTNGFMIDLIDDTVDSIVGTPTFSFTFGDSSDWDISDFLNTGKITFGAAMMGIDGDYNNSGQVEQGDLDLVLLNWGTQLNAPWVTGIVDQAELDTVLLNWGNVAALGGTAGVPEPGTFWLLLTIVGLTVMHRVRRHGSYVASVLMIAVTVGTSQAQTTPGFTGRLLDLSEVLNEHSEAEGLSRGVGLRPSLIQADITDLVTVADLAGGGGLFSRNHPYPGGITVPGDGNDFVVTLEATVTIPAGTWQIAYGTDDGGALQLNGVFFDERFNEEDPVSGSFFGMHSDSLFYDDTRGQGWTSGVFSVNQPTTTRFYHSFSERGGGDLSEVVIRDANQFSVIVQRGQAIDPVLDSWVLLEDGALGWGVKTDLDPNAGPVQHVAGRNLVGTVHRSTSLQNTVEGPAELVEGQVRLQRWAGDLGSWDSLAQIRTFMESNGPVHSALAGVMMFNSGELYPAELGYGHIGIGGEANIGVVYSGEMLITNNNVVFKDGNNDFAGLVIDTNGDGVLDYNDPSEVIIDDDTNTNVVGSGNNGSPISFATFSGSLTGENAWRKFEFYASAEGSGNNAALAWDQNTNHPEAPEFPFLETDPFFPEHLIPPERLRTRVGGLVSGEAVADLAIAAGASIAFEIDIAGNASDQVGITNPDPTVLTGILNVDGADILVNVINGSPSAGFTADLIDDSVDQIVGTPTFSFSFGEASMWDISDFTNTGRITFLGGAGSAAGIPEPSTWVLFTVAAGLLALTCRRRRD